MPASAAYGTWDSPLSAAHVAAAGRRIADLVIADGLVYWGETRPDEGGRVTIMQRAFDGAIAEVLPVPFNARTRVHEYGGGAFCVANGVVYFSNFADQRLYSVRAGEMPTPLTDAGAWRYADGVVDRARHRIICVREDHSGGGHEPRNEIVDVDLGTGAVRVLVAGNDFYSNPRLCPTGDRLCWLTWDHPDMPWDGTRLMTASVAGDGALGAPRCVAGSRTEAIYCPQWSPTGVLHFVSDNSGWWNLFRQRGDQIEALWSLDAEFGLPLWTFGTSTYGFDGDDVIGAFGPAGSRRLARIPADGGAPVESDVAYTELGGITVADGQAILVAATPAVAPELIAVDLVSQRSTTLRQPAPAALAADHVSKPETIEFQSTTGTVHAFFYRPCNPGFSAPVNERPPLIVICHGGPTGSTSTAFNAGIQYWTTRGIAVLDVNYGGSTGYGREYRRRLAGQWGIVDVADCANGALFLADHGDVDRARLLIRGGSAGGYTTLCALTFGDTFRAGASHYGVADLETLATDTHKFESRYLDGLVGPYPARRDLYQARSPIHHVDELRCPIIFFQGLDDKVVPPSQAEVMVAALRAKGLPVAYVPFAGEGHGFRRAENIQRALEAELYFYGRVLGFTPAGDIAAVQIDNLST